MKIGITSQALADGLGLSTPPGVITGFSRGNSLEEAFPAVSFHASIAPGYNGGILPMTLGCGTETL